MSISVAADSEEQALEKAWAHYHQHGAEEFSIEWEATSDTTNKNLQASADADLYHPDDCTIR